MSIYVYSKKDRKGKLGWYYVDHEDEPRGPYNTEESAIRASERYDADERRAHIENYHYPIKCPNCGETMEPDYQQIAEDEEIDELPTKGMPNAFHPIYPNRNPFENSGE